jgi:hypothetical protein
MKGGTMTEPTLTPDQVQEAVVQMTTHCELKMANYDMVSARGTLYELGYHGEHAEQVLQFLYDHGFTYCLDPFYHKSPRGDDSGPISQDVCYWGPDQLKSRLDCV